jgi:hypothetical protein
MSKPEPEKKPSKKSAPSREDRLAEQLRKNLKRRKAAKPTQSGTEKP